MSGYGDLRSRLETAGVEENELVDLVDAVKSLTGVQTSFPEHTRCIQTKRCRIGSRFPVTVMEASMTVSMTVSLSLCSAFILCSSCLPRGPWPALHLFVDFLARATSDEIDRVG
jgi:hypothetical protein